MLESARHGRVTPASELAREWTRASADFAPDGSLRDIYVLDTTIDDWQRVLDHLRARGGAVFTVDGLPHPLPESAAGLFALRERAMPTMGCDVGGVRLACHFFSPAEIEFDFSPEEVDGPERLRELLAFVEELGRVTGKPVRLTPEDVSERPIFRYEPGASHAVFVAPAERDSAAPQR